MPFTPSYEPILVQGAIDEAIEKLKSLKIDLDEKLKVSTREQARLKGPMFSIYQSVLLLFKRSLISSGSQKHNFLKN